jgi:flagellar hook-associated protein 3 FlgL
LKNLQAGMSNVTNLNASLGATIQRVTALQNQMTQYATTMTNQKSTLEDANMAQVITQFSTDQTVYQSALKMGSEVLLPSLVSFLPNG